jgi:hypothetical protein
MGEWDQNEAQIDQPFVIAGAAKQSSLAKREARVGRRPI